MVEHSPGVPLIPWHFENSDKPVQGTGRRKQVKPYVRADFCELRGIQAPALIVWLMLLRQWAATKKEWVSIPKRIRQEADVSRWRIIRGLAMLEEDGFIELRKEPGKSNRARRK